MSSTPRQRILDALSHRQPTETPFSWGLGLTAAMQDDMRQHCAGLGLDWDLLREAVDDRRLLFSHWTQPLPAERDGVIINEWGIHMRQVSYGKGSYREFVDFPLAAATTAADLDLHAWPDPSHWDANALRETIISGDPQRQRAVVLAAGNPFEIYSWLTGLEQAMVNLAENPELVTDALTRITSICDARVRANFKAAGDLIDMVFYADDLGGQEKLLISRPTYRRMIQPHHRRLCATVREVAPHAKILFHSDGAVFDILPDLVDSGIDCLEAVQTDAGGMVPERLKERWAGKLAFHGAISVQQILPRGTPETVAEECRHLERVLGAGGGWIAAPTHAVQVGTPPANVLAMVETILGAERWAAAIETSRLLTAVAC
ncbi:MAG: uroporphyrinogen decarboxylase family protein [Planctomycetota bacterium]